MGKSFLNEEVKMKKTILVFTLFAFVTSVGVFAQPVSGKKFEFSTSASIWNIKYKDADESTTIVNLPLRFGFFIFKGLEIEPEVMLTIPDESEETGYFLSGNLAYNFNASEKAILFILVGVGYGNGTEAFSWVWDQDMGVTLINAGGGVKWLVGDSAALRLEYRFSNYSGKKEETYNYWGYSWTETYELDRTDHKFFVGLSIFF